MQAINAPRHAEWHVAVGLTFLFCSAAQAQDITRQQGAINVLAAPGAVMPSELESLHKQDMSNLLTQGYIERLEDEPRAEYIQSRMAERRADVQRRKLAESRETLGYVELDADQTALGQLPHRPTILPSKFLRTGSIGYVLLGGHKLKQLHTNTQFGTLVIDEILNSSTTIEAPNATIAGQPAKLVRIKHKGDKWATVIYAPSGDRLLIVESNRRIDGKSEDEFVKMVEELSLGAK
jgi:hypothetical protein